MVWCALRPVNPDATQLRTPPRRWVVEQFAMGQSRRLAPQRGRRGQGMRPVLAFLDAGTVAELEMIDCASARQFPKAVTARTSQ
jgi:hypothetical protein